jgi:hypothetical protein
MQQSMPCINRQKPRKSILGAADLATFEAVPESSRKLNARVKSNCGKGDQGVISIAIHRWRQRQLCKSSLQSLTIDQSRAINARVELEIERPNHALDRHRLKTKGAIQCKQ